MPHARRRRPRPRVRPLSGACPPRGGRPSLAAASPALALAALALLGTASPALAQATFGGQVRPRFEVLDVEGRTDAFTSMRTRAHLDAVPAPHVRVFVQLQDVRLWGEETSTLGDYRADALDLHQGFVEVGYEGDSPLWARAGRQEVALGGERLVGAVDWTQQARAFDGVRGAWSRGSARLDLFGFQLAEERAGALGDALFAGGVASFAPGPGRNVELYGLHDREESAADVSRTTLGLRYAAATGPWSYRAEGYWQTGEARGLDVDAYLLGARVGRTFAEGEAGVTLWYDLLSGDEDPDDGEVGVFTTLYATNHKFYGYADLFLDIPLHTGGRGLQDVALKTFWDPVDGVRLSADLHHFRATEAQGLSSARLAEEVDLTARWTYAPGVVLTGGVSRVLQHEALAEIGRLGDDMTFGYVMLSTAF